MCVFVYASLFLISLSLYSVFFLFPLVTYAFWLSRSLPSNVYTILVVFLLSFGFSRWFCHWGSDYRHCYSCYVISFASFLFTSYFFHVSSGVLDVTSPFDSYRSFLFIPLTWRLIFNLCMHSPFICWRFIYPLTVVY